jgi:hypothetical protein
MSWAVPEVPTMQPTGDATNLLTKRVLICTPTRNRQVGDNYRRAVDEMRCRLPEQTVPLIDFPQHVDGEQAALLQPSLYAAGDCPTGVLSAPHDLARTRDRMMRQFIERTTADWLLWWDDDVWQRGPQVALAGMMAVATACDVHVLGALYPRKQRDEQRVVEAVRSGKSDPLRHAFTINDMRMYRRRDCTTQTPHPWLLPVNGVGFGFCLVSRTAVIALTERFRAKRSWVDHLLGGKTVGLCHEILNDYDATAEDEAMSEDYSFCARAETSGFPVYAFLGPGTPMIHDGMDSFEADPECLAHMRKAGPP